MMEEGWVIVEGCSLTRILCMCVCVCFELLFNRGPPEGDDGRGEQMW